MVKFLSTVSVLAIVAVAGAAVDTRLYLAPVGAGSVPFTGGAGPFSPTQVGASAADGGVGAHIYTSTSVGTGGVDAPAPGVPVGVAGDVFAVWARTENGTAPDGSAIRGLNLQVVTTGSVTATSAWVQWRAGTAPTNNYRWEAASDFSGPEVTFLGGLGGAGRGWQLQTGSSDRLDDFTVTDAKAGLGNGEILLGYIRAEGGVGSIQLRLGVNGVNHADGTRVAFGDGTAYIPGGTGAAGRGYGDQAIIVPEPATLALLALAGLAIRRR